MLLRVPVVALGVVILAGSAAAQHTGTATATAQPLAHPGSLVPTATAVRLAHTPVLDGDVLGDEAWRRVEPFSTFWQTNPDEGQPASEQTEVRIGYTDAVLYFGIVCFDREPQRIVVSESRRDSPLEDTDSVLILLDTYFDRQNAFVFATTPAGIEHDGQVTNEGRGADQTATRQRGGSAAGFNVNWDGVWEVRTRVDDFGWSAEFAIPLRTLRYRGGAQRWGLNVQRNVRRRNETSFWAPVSRQFNLYRVSAAGTLEGLDLQPQRNLKAAPYILGESQRTRAGGVERDGDVGFDVKYGITPALTLDATVNTDFAQVEVDEQQINLDRFSLFFPEKRPFFLENAGHFAVGMPGDVELFFSRRIGIGPQGEEVPIAGGARLSGRMGGATIGLLNMQTRETEEIAASNFTVARVRRDLPNRSGVGFIVTNREGTGRLTHGDDHNRAYGVDGQWGIGRHVQLSGFAARTATPRIAEDEHAYQLSAAYEGPGWELSGKYTEVGEGFNPEVGFLRRKGYRRPDLTIVRRYRPRRFMRVHELRPHVQYRAFWKPDGFLESSIVHIDNHLEWKNGAQLQTGINLTREGVLTAFPIHPGVNVPAGTYEHREAMIVVISNQGAPLSFNARMFAGGFFGGRRLSLAPAVRWRRGDSLGVELRWDHNNIDLPLGRFKTNLARLRTSYAFTPRVFAQALVQYNDQIDRWSTNLRVGWIQTANTGLFIVYNENREAGGLVTGLRDRTFTVKFSRLFDLLH